MSTLSRGAASQPRVIIGVEYAQIEGFRPLVADLYLPTASAAALPAVVHIHGGGWRVGRRSSLGPLADKMDVGLLPRMAAAGYVVMSIDYRLSGEAVFPAQLHDAKSAVRWLRKNADQYGVDPERIFAWGESAGGHLASLLGLTWMRDDLEGGNGTLGVTSRVAAVIDWYGPTDLFQIPQQMLPGSGPLEGPNSRESALIGADCAKNKELAAAASPITYVTSGAPPFFIAHGTSDMFVPPLQSSTFANALRAAGADVELYLVEGANHFWFLPDGSIDAVEKVFARTLQFLDGVSTTVADKTA